MVIILSKRKNRAHQVGSALLEGLHSASPAMGLSFGVRENLTFDIPQPKTILSTLDISHTRFYGAKHMSRPHDTSFYQTLRNNFV